MTSIGNDIVDLKHTDPQRTIQPKFYSKFLSAADKQLYNPSFQIPFAHFVWLLWSVKESAYKCLQRQQRGLVFSPVKIEVHDIIPPIIPPLLPIPDIIENTAFNVKECFRCRISFNAQTLYARSVIYGDDLIHTIVCDEDNFENIVWGIKQTGETDQSAAVRSFLGNRLAMLYHGETFNIIKIDAGVPTVSIGSKKLLPVTFSHHGKYVGYAFTSGSRP